MSKKLRGNFMLILTALIWGSAFVAQKAGMDQIGPFTFNCVRCIIGAIVLIPAIMFLDKQKSKSEPDAKELTLEEKDAQKKVLIAGGVSCGLILFIASSLQQIGVVYTTAGKAGFITALYIVIGPILGLLLKKKVRPIIWCCVAIAAAGLYLLCMPAGGFDISSINKGDLLILCCAFFFSIHILVIDHFSPKTDGVRMSCIQFAVAGIVSIIPMFVFETPEIASILSCWVPILYAGVLSCGVAYTLQIIAQKDADPTIASLILSLESVFAVLAGMVILRESFSLREIIGCLVMFAAILLAQMPDKKNVTI